VIYTLGHSTLGLEAFLALVKPLQVVMDVRSHPTSRWSLFLRESLEPLLRTVGVEYVWEPDLGGWSERFPQHRNWATAHGVDFAVYTMGKFPKQRIAAQVGLTTGQACWTNQGLLDYSWFMATPEYLAAFDRLRQLGVSNHIGIMCAEILPWKCHRSLIADHLVFTGADVLHLQPKLMLHSRMVTTPHRLTRYHADILRVWRDHDAQRAL
jgi:uncharacterized protein (DUF488 family)